MLALAYPSASAQEVGVDIGRLLLGPGEVQDQVQLHNQAMIWVVKASLATQGSSGLLQQLYAADRSAPSPHPPPLIGETNSAIVLQTLADARALNGADKQSDTGATIVLVDLKLLSSLA